MTPEHYSALLTAAGAKADPDWSKLPDGQTITLHVASQGTGLSVPRIESICCDGPLVRARTAKGEEFVLALQGSHRHPSGVGT
jgi:hypothetical protein